ncbi:hypothetical protein [Hymenobacter lucidus]|uniref:Uncharacterized protein n=1 Tax=Hymenobacter lucidus TaxID=2880930 RepID=A0ABS8AM55_9BACT|nr:hypothetical protein [Hymenobacter lucidus]MCB2407295.1 hypothetical protein [Hymenobacter lucidus]
MKNVLHLLTGFTLAAIFSCATPVATAAQGVSSGSQPLAPASPECQARSLKLTCYYTDALRLSSSQAAAVRLATQQELQQLEQLEAAIVDESAKTLPFTATQVLAQYDAHMLSILTPGQYNAFHLLQERQASLTLINHVARK